MSGDILISDAFTLKEVNDIAYEVDCAAAEKCEVSCIYVYILEGGILTMILCR